MSCCFGKQVIRGEASIRDIASIAKRSTPKFVRQHIPKHRCNTRGALIGYVQTAGRTLARAGGR